MTDIPVAAISHASRLYGLAEQVKLFAKSHTHSNATIFLSQRQNQDCMLKISKIIKNRNPAITLYRLRFAEFLAQNKIPTIQPILSTQNKLVETFDIEGQIYEAYAWPKIAGIALTDLHPQMLKNFYQRWAKLLSQLHALSSSHNTYGLFEDQEYARYHLHWHREWEICEHKLCEPELKELWHEIRYQLDSLSGSKSTFGLIHADAHPKNILDDGNDLHLLDFDRCCYHFFGIDIANSIYSEYSRIGFHSKHTRALPDLAQLFLKPFITSYLSHFDLPMAELKQIELFLKYRRVLMYSIFYDEIKLAAPKYLEQFKMELIQNKSFLDFSLTELI